MKRSSPWLTAVLQTVILLSVVACASPWLDAEERPTPTPHRFDDVALRGIAARPVFNGSVVPGGVYSRDELRSAIGRDPVVASHYREVNVGDMHPVTLTEGKAAYVSYRVGARVYWTRERVWLKAGETVLTDGATVIRARCGNCVSDVKQENVAAVDPAHGELDDFVVPPTPDTGVDAPGGADAELGNLLQVPFAPQALASLAPPGALLTPDVLDDAFGERGSPSFGAPPLVLPTGGGVLGPPGQPGGGGNGVGPTPPSGPGPGEPPAVPPPGFVPPEDGTGSPGPGTGSPGDGTSSGSPGDTLTTGFSEDTTSTASTGTPTGGSTTGAGGTTTNGSLTDGSVFPTTEGVTTSSTGAAPAPEPEVLWLVASGIIGLASRRLRSR